MENQWVTVSCWGSRENEAGANSNRRFLRISGKGPELSFGMNLGGIRKVDQLEAERCLNFGRA